MRVLTAMAASTLLLGGIASAQAPTPNPTNKTGVIGLMHAIHSTNGPKVAASCKMPDSRSSIRFWFTDWTGLVEIPA